MSKTPSASLPVHLQDILSTKYQTNAVPRHPLYLSPTQMTSFCNIIVSSQKPDLCKPRCSHFINTNTPAKLLFMTLYTQVCTHPRPSSGQVAYDQLPRWSSRVSLDISSKWVNVQIKNSTAFKEYEDLFGGRVTTIRRQNAFNPKTNQMPEYCISV